MFNSHVQSGNEFAARAFASEKPLTIAEANEMGKAKGVRVEKNPDAAGMWLVTAKGKAQGHEPMSRLVFARLLTEEFGFVASTFAADASSLHASYAEYTRWLARSGGADAGATAGVYRKLASVCNDLAAHYDTQPNRYSAPAFGANPSGRPSYVTAWIDGIDINCKRMAGLVSKLMRQPDKLTVAQIASIARAIGEYCQDLSKEESI